MNDTITCPNCNARLAAPLDRVTLSVKCQRCGNAWEWISPFEVVQYPKSEFRQTDEGRCPSCPYCNGAGEVSGNMDDVNFTFQCVCSGGNEEAVRWLLS